jgi:CRP/FNR family nitrogen fixation transcriptional regulator
MLSSAAANSQTVPPAIWLRTPWTEELGRPRGPTAAPLRFTPDQEIYAEGDEAEAFFKVHSGVVRSCRFCPDGRRQIAAFYVAGDIFGVEPGTEYRLTAEAVSDCVLIPYRRRSIEALALQDADLARKLFGHAMQGLARAQDHALLLGRKGAVERVSSFLLEWAARTSAASVISLAMTRQDIADYLGLTIETVSRSLSQLERDSVIELMTPRDIRVRQRAVLSAA